MTKEYERRGETIGQEIRKNGYIYMNIGDLSHNENWILAGKYEPVYYVNVYRKDDTYEIKIEDSFIEEAHDSIECEAERDTYMTVKLNEDFYSNYGVVEINNERFEHVKTIIKTDPYLKKHHQSYMNE